MLTPKKLPDTWQEALKIINRCPICSESYTPDSAKLFAKHENATLIHITCPKCRSYFVAMVLMVGQGMSSVGMVTDLSFEDVERLFRTDALTTDEIIEGYEELERNNFLHRLLLKS